jgi:pimeloyl-ACP methyl ester carboxylesterase
MTSAWPMRREHPAEGGCAHMTDQPRYIDTPDGRRLEAYITGPERGSVLVYHGGTPSAGPLYQPVVAEAARRGLRTLNWSRPGYAGSTRLPGRSVAQVADDVATVLDALDVERCYVAGESGGGPHTLATAALLPDRVIAAATIASVAPYGAEGLDWSAGMGAENLEEFGAAVAGPSELEAFLRQFADALRAISAAEVADSLGDLIPDVDRAALTGEFAESTAASLRASVSSGIWGWFDDDIAFTTPWGFDLASIRVPVTVWQGKQDRMVPYSHAEWLAAHIPGAQLRLEPELGHLSLEVEAFPHVLDELLAAG